MGGTDAAVEGVVAQIQRMSTEDGPGLRSTAFLKGCPLACAWCHNPECIEPRPRIQWEGSRCIQGATADGCLACLRACARGALTRGRDGAVVVDQALCQGCAACAEACPGGALERVGQRYAAADLARELLKDRAYFGRSDRGGVTLSGGEASLQGAFALETLRLCRAQGVHTALDTCGVASWAVLKALYQETDLVLYDLKEADPARHKAFTGLDNAIVFGNLERTVALMKEAPMPGALWLRTPIIPGATDREENLFALGQRVAALAPARLERWELCAFNPLCAGKYLKEGRAWAFAGASLMTAGAMAGLAEAARRGAQGRVAVTWTGAVRLEP